MNRGSFLALAARGVEAAVMVLAMALVVVRTDAAEQGLFVSFLGFGGVLGLFDFGLSYSCLLVASQQAATGAGARLGAFRALALRLGTATACLGMVAVGLFGAFLMARAAPADQWLAPWCVFLACAGLAQVLALRLAVHEGAVSVAAAWSVRLVQEVLGGVALVVALLAGLGLWGIAAWAALRLAVVLAWSIAGRSAPAVPRLGVRARFDLVAWRREIWPFQWKVGISGITAFLIFRSMPLIILAVRGPEDAGRFGLSLAIVNMVLGVTTVWPYSQVRPIAALMTAGAIDRVLALARRITVLSVALVFAAGVAFIALQWLAIERGWNVAARMGDPETNAWLMAAALIHQGTACWAVVVRAERQDPMLPLSIFGGLALIGAIVYAAHGTDLRDVAIANFIVTLAGIPFVWWVLRQFLAPRSAPA